MKRLFVTLVLVSILMLLASNGFTEISEGASEIGGLISWTNHNADPGPFDASFLSAGIFYNYYLGENYSIGGALNIDQLDAEVLTDDAVVWSLHVRGDYYFFPESTNLAYVPYVGLQLGLAGYDNADMDGDDYTYGVHGGVKLFVAENVAVNLEATYDFLEVRNTDIDSLSLLVGISFFF